MYAHMRLVLFAECSGHLWFDAWLLQLLRFVTAPFNDTAAVRIVATDWLHFLCYNMHDPMSMIFKTNMKNELNTHRSAWNWVMIPVQGTIFFMQIEWNFWFFYIDRHTNTGNIYLRRDHFLNFVNFAQYLFIN